MTIEMFGAQRLRTESVGAEGSPRPSITERSRARLLTAQEGRALVRVALQQPIASEKPDCSHLVHQILNDAGLTYRYATSVEIFAGIPEFRRVRYPQPGDLIVWPGHVGLVVDPKQTIFLSSTDSGVRTDEYTSNYWRHRGYHRFYRYIVTPTAQLAAHRLTEEHAVKPTHQAEVTAWLEPSSAQETLGADSSSKAAAATEASPDDLPVPPPDRDFSATIPIATQNGLPTKNGLEQAISELMSVPEDALEGASTSVPVVFVRSWKVEKIKLNGDEGWVELRIKPGGERNPDGTWKKSRVQKLHFDLRRDQTGWTLFPPRDRLYVSAQSR